MWLPLGCAMRIVKNIFSQLHIYMIWLILSALLWGWIFTFVTDTVPAKKVVLFVDAPACQDLELRMELEKDMPEGLRMVQVHPFTYAMFDENTLLNADLYIVPASKVEEYRDSFAPLDDTVLPGQTRGPLDGIRVYDRAAGTGTADALITYAAPGTEAEDYYLFFGANSLHAAALTGSGDNAALAVAETLLNMK